MQRAIYHAVPLRGRFSDERPDTMDKRCLPSSERISVSGMKVVVVGGVGLRELQCGQPHTHQPDAAQAGKVMPEKFF